MVATIDMLQHGVRPCGSLRVGLRSDGRFLTPVNECPDAWEGPSEVLTYISKLRITDPDFYDVFSAPEIYALFKPEEASSPVPFYVWDEHPGIRQYADNCGGLSEGGAFLDAAFSFYTDLIKSKWRVYDPAEALIHYVPIESGRTDRCSVNETLTDEAVQEIMSSPHWVRYNGSNFFWISSTYMNEIAESGHEKQIMSSDDLSGMGHLSDAEAFRVKISTFFQASNPHLRMCSAKVPFSPAVRFRNLRSYPHGELESYVFPGGHYRQVNLQRPYNLHFMGLADGREGYYSRVVALKSLPGQFEPSILVRYREMESLKLPMCQSESSLEGCQLPRNLSDSGLFTRTLIQAKFGLHFRGDEFSSARFSDIVAAGAIPIVVMREALDISIDGQCFIPWRAIALFVSHNDFVTSPVESIRKVLDSLTPLDLEKRYRLLHYYRPLLLHGLGKPDAAQKMIQSYATQCLPESLLNTKELSKRTLACTQDDFTKFQQWQNLPDEDTAELPWSPSWIDQAQRNV